MLLGAIEAASCAEITPGCVVKIVLHRRLAAIVLLVALFGANTAMASSLPCWRN